MPGWYLLLSAAVGLLVLAGVAYSALKERRRAFAGAGTEFDPTYADAPIRREAEGVPREPVARDEELATRGR
jgi:hypothetical protein